MKKRDLILNTVIVTSSVLFAALVFELVCAVFFPYKTFGTATEMFWERRIRSYKPWLMVDPQFGFRPKLNNEAYNQFGTMVNKYSAEKNPKITRILFVGDSVTESGFFMEALKKQFGEEKYEYWNAGVGSFNTVQEVKFYETYNYKLNPDIVILGFHVNDFETTPVAFFDGSGVVMYAPYMPSHYISPFFYRYSRIYRMYLSYFHAKNYAVHKKEIIDEVHAAFSRFAVRLKKDRIRFIALMYPVCRPYAKWTENEKTSRERAIEMFESSEVEYYDLMPLMEAAAEKGIKLASYDDLHPSEELCGYFAEYFKKNEVIK